MGKISRLLKKVKSNTKLSYLRDLEKPIDEHLVLMEAGQGLNVNGNMFAMLKEICNNKRWNEYRCVFVVTEKTKEKAQARMKAYGFNNVELLVRNSDEYCTALATAKYIMTDNSFPPYFLKREEQVFLNTWHGTPLKTLGKSDKSNMASLANIQKNYLMSDYALFPNEFTRDVFMNDYDLRDLYQGNILVANYPRNYVFYDKAQGEEMKKRLGYEDKTVYAYMPTWRGTGRKANTQKQIEIITELLTQIDNLLDDSMVLLVNLHFLLSEGVDCGQFKHIEYFPSEFETYEVLNGSDGLITDYSSVFFDYAASGKKIIMFAYDREEYLASRGMYLDMDELPFPIVETSEALVAEMHQPVTPYPEFQAEYCGTGWVNSCERIFELMTTGKAEGLNPYKNEDAGKNLCFIYAGKLNAVHYDAIISYMEKNPGFKYVLIYRQNFTNASKEFVVGLDSSVSTLGTITAFQITPAEAANIALKRYDSDAVTAFREREAKRLFYGLKPERVLDFSRGNFTIALLLSALTGEKSYIVHGDFYCVSRKMAKKYAKVAAYESAHGFDELNLSTQENLGYFSTKEDDIAHPSYARNTHFKNLIPICFNTRKGMHLVSLYTLNVPYPINREKVRFTIGENEYKPKVRNFGKKENRKFWGLFRLFIPGEDILDMPANNGVFAVFPTRYNLIVKKQMTFCSLLGHKLLGLRGPIYKHPGTDTVAAFRQMTRNRLSVYVRSANKTDKFTHHFMLYIAQVVAFFWRSEKAKNLILLYEKNSSKYEESASVLYERLMDKGYENAYFIVDKDYEYFDEIPEQYRKNLIYKYTFKHYLYFLACHTFIGTEALVHAYDLKTFNALALRKIKSKDLNYVFLQHGVMYMVSLDSESRRMFKRKNLKGCYRVITSSHKEAEHFTELGRHYEEDIYVCGLPKFDRSVMLPGADKIVIMPTWRPWEINAVREDFFSTAYFGMVMRIYESVPDDLKDKVMILPHPLVLGELKKVNHPLLEKVAIDQRYDDILKETAVLITDYSSIAYDAFYRGARVIFYWEEKDECLEHYGPTTKLMLNEENVYGDFFYNTDGLTEAIEKNYRNEQTDLYKERYSHLVEFHDGHNTDRLIEMLKKDEII